MGTGWGYLKVWQGTIDEVDENAFEVGWVGRKLCLCLTYELRLELWEVEWERGSYLLYVEPEEEDVNWVLS